MKRTLVVMSAVALIGAAFGSQLAAQGEQTATQFYMSYRAAFAKAAKVEELFPFMGAAQRAQVEKTPAAERPEMFQFIKELNSFSSVKVLKETRSATGATLEVEGIAPDKTKATATVEVMREGGAWKIGKESWKQ